MRLIDSICFFVVAAFVIGICILWSGGATQRNTVALTKVGVLDVLDESISHYEEVLRTCQDEEDFGAHYFGRTEATKAKLDVLREERELLAGTSIQELLERGRKER